MDSRRERWQADALCIAALLALVAATFADVLVFRRNFFFRDLYLYHFPMKAAVRATIAAGEVPWWNPLVSGGQPMMANPAYEIFYPLQWLIFVGSYPFGFALHIVVHVALAAVGMYALLRTLSLRTVAALAGAVSFGLGGFLLSSTTTLPMMFVWSWAPLVAALLLRWLRQRTRLRFALLLLASAMQALIAEPMALASVWLLLAVAVFRYERSGDGGEVGPTRGQAFGRAAGTVAALALATFLLAAVQLVPMLDHARDSARARGFAYETVVDYSLPLGRLAELIDPQAAQERPAIPAASPLPRFTPRTHYLPTLYCGIAVLLFAVSGWLARAPGSLTAAVVTCLSLVLASGDRTPLFRWLYAAGLRSIRYPEKFIAIALFTLIVFASSALSRHLDGDRRMRRSAVLAAVLLFVVALAMAFRGRIGVLPLVELGALLLLLSLATRAATNPARNAVGWAVLLVVAGDAVVHAQSAAPRAPAAYFETPPVARAIAREGDGYAVFHRGAWQPSSDWQRWSAADPLWAQQHSLRPFTAEAWGLRGALELDYDETDLLPTHDLLEAMQRFASSGARDWSEPFALMANAGYVVDDAGFDGAMRRAGGDVHQAFPIRVRRSRERMPRVFFARRLIEAHSVSDVVRHLQQEPLAPATAFVPIAAFVPASGRIAALRESRSGADLDVDVSGAGFLVITVTRHKYWRVTIDGAEVAVVPANLAFQGIVVPPGRHHVGMRYRNPLVVASGAVSLAMLVGIAALLLAHRRGVGATES